MYRRGLLDFENDFTAIGVRLHLLMRLRDLLPRIHLKSYQRSHLSNSTTTTRKPQPLTKRTSSM